MRAYYFLQSCKLKNQFDINQWAEKIWLSPKTQTSQKAVRIVSRFFQL